MKVYLHPLFLYLESNPDLIKTFTGFLLNPKELIFYFGKTHLAIEYVGNELMENLPKGKSVVNFRYYDLLDQTDDFIEMIIGFKSDSTTSFGFPLPPYAEDLIIPTNKGADKLVEMKWNFDAQDSILAFNAGKCFIPFGQYTRLVNCMFFDANDNGLKTRHIKWIDFIPLQYQKGKEGYSTIKINFDILKQQVKYDAHFIYPIPDKDDFKYSKLPQLNRFIELIGNNQISEPEITEFLNKENNRFILTMSFFSKQIYHQYKCKWQSENKPDIIPDYFVLQPNGFANIVEFKLPLLKSKIQTGKPNRQTFSAEISSYIAQTRNYKSYFDDPNNRRWFESKYFLKSFTLKDI